MCLALYCARRSNTTTSGWPGDGCPGSANHAVCFEVLLL